MIDLGITINGETKTLEWNGNTFPLEEISNASFKCHYDDIGKPPSCISEGISIESNYECKYAKEINMNKEKMGGSHSAKNNFAFHNESSADDYYLKDRTNKNSCNSHSMNKANSCYSNISPIINDEHAQIKTNKEILEDCKNNLRNKIKERRNKREQNALSDKTKMFINSMAASTCDFCNLMQLFNQNE